MSISEKIKAINNKIKWNKAQYDLVIQIVKIAAFLSGNVSKYEFLTGKDLLLEKDMSIHIHWHCKETVPISRQYLWVWWNK